MTKAQEVARDLRSLITAGDLQQGDALPSETKLMEQYGYSRETIRAGVRILIQEGLVVTGQGQGKFVREKPPALAWNWSTHSVANWPSHAVPLSVTVTIETPSDFVRERLALPKGGLVVVRESVFRYNEVPYAVTKNHLPRQVAEDMALMDPEVTPEILVPRHHDQIRSRMPSLEETAVLELPTATPVAEHIRVGFDSEDVPQFCKVTVLPGDRNLLIYEGFTH